MGPGAVPGWLEHTHALGAIRAEGVFPKAQAENYREPPPGSTGGSKSWAGIDVPSSKTMLTVLPGDVQKAS